MKKRFGLASLLLVFLGGHAAAQPSSPPVSMAQKLKVSADESLALIVPAKGVQIYECRPGKEAAYEWAFVGPEAELFNTQGMKIGRHYAGPSWEAADGSKIVASVKASAAAPNAGAIPWLLLGAKSVGPEGAFSKVSSIRRVHTAGGMAPITGCSEVEIGRVERVPYTADYFFFTKE